MKKLLALLWGVFCLCQVSSAQIITFDKSFHSNWTGALYDVDQTNDGGYVAIGSIGRPSTTQQGILNIYVRKYNQFGDTLWTKAIGGNGYIFPGSIEQTTDGGYIVCGQDINSLNQAYVAKLDASGNTTWQKWFGNLGAMAYFSSVKQHQNGSFTTVGGIRNTNNSTTYVYLVKLNTLGDTIFTRTYKQVTGLEYIGRELEITSDKGYFITASEFPTPFWGGQCVLFKTDSLGNQQWVKSYPIADGFSGKQTADGGYIIGGKRSPYTWQPDQAVLYKLNQAGDTVWTKRYPGHIMHSVIQTNDGGYAFTGSVVADTIRFSTNQGNTMAVTQNLLAAKMDASGNMRFLRIYGDSLDDAGYSIKQTNDGGFIIAGAKDYDFSPGISQISWASNKGLLLKIGFTAQDAVLSVSKDFKAAVSFQMFPNPASSEVRLLVEKEKLGAGSLKISLKNMLGQEVLSQVMNNAEVVLKRGQLRSGVYLVHLTDAKTGEIKGIKRLVLN